MNSVLIFLFTICLSTVANAQSATEYVELLCANKEKIASVYSSDPIDEIMALKTREQNFWSLRKAEAIATANLIKKEGVEALQNQKHTDTTVAVLKACNAYFTIEPQIKEFLQNSQCVDDQGVEYEIEQVGTACRLLFPER